ncbi:hypothetical protein CBR_g19418 [Chara braunii]|uniref:Integrase catalytic domain-containing protein n=1 Tax=Chara braunii TaxID=69332 RepID=A0A388KXY0_CHABU|nr:hypothetical protein CBR_g19418 [Chara braunii]|eukprot:GBG74905.1 hypothetical protein CBR_g19418 [Chara braunii]
MLRRSNRIAAREGRAAAAEQQLPLPHPSEMDTQGNPMVDNAASGSPHEACSSNPPVPQAQQEGSTATSAGTLDAAPVRQQGETMKAFLARLGTYMQQVQEEQQCEAAAEAARLNNIARAEEQRRRQQADAATNHNKARRDAASVLMQQEAAHTAALQAWNVDPAATTEPTTEEQTKSALANMMYQVILTCNWQQVELARQAHTIAEYEETLKSLHARLDMLGKDDVPHRQTASSSIDPSIHELEGRLDHLVEQFPTPDDHQPANSRPTSGPASTAAATNWTCNKLTPKQFKMPKFSIDKFDDYHKADPISVKVSKLYAKITWEAMTEKWRKRFIVDDAQGKGVNRIFRMHQGSQPTREWLTEWQKIVTILNLDIPFVHLRREFFQRSVDALSTALGESNLYMDFDQIVEKACEVIQTNRWTANERRSPPNFVEKGKGPRPQQVAAVQGNGQENDQAVTHEQRRRPSTAKLGKLSFAGSEATPVLTPPDTVALLTTSSTSGEHAYDACLREDYEDYAVQLVPPLDQPLHVQESYACATSSPSPSEPASSPTSLGDLSVWSRLEELDALTPEDFQLLPLSPSCSLLKPHCNALMAELRNYLHAAVPAPLMEDGVAVVDLREYIVKIDRKYTTQRYDDTDVPLLYVRIRIGKVTCSALIDCGATRNYISQDFMTRAGLGPPVRRKSQPTQVMLADGRTHKSIDRCIDSVPVYFAPLAREAVSFDILDTKFDMILGMSWLRSEDHPVNFYRRTVHICDRNGVLVPCTVPPPHPSIGCHVVSTASIRNSIARNDVEEMGICCLHALPPLDEPAEEQPPDPRIVQLIDSYGNVFEAPAGIVPNRPIRHEIILEDGAVPPRGCIYRMIEEELEHIVHLRAVLDRLRTAKYKANQAKCEFAQQELKYLGHFVTLQGIRQLADKIKAIQDWPEPTNTTEVRSFMGLVGYYQRFIGGYARIAASLSILQSPQVPFQFTDEVRSSFHKLKTTLLLAPVLSIYDPTLPTRVTTDASGYGMGAVLEQHDGVDWHPVEYFSQKVPPINTIDDARKKELFVTMLKRWRHFLLGRRRFTWVTDNNPLTYCKTQDTVSSTIARWMYFIDQFDFTPKHIPGLSNRAADALSRRSDLCAVTHHAFSFDETLHQHFVRAYKSDPEYATLYKQLSLDHPPASHYHVVDGYLLLHSRGKDLLCVPHDRRLRTRLLGEYHDSRLAGHLGINRTIARLRQRFRWPDLITDVTRYCDSCEVCRRSKPRNRNPYDIVSDRDTRFMSGFWTSLVKESDTEMKPSSVRHPQTDGQTERAHQTAQVMLSTLIRMDQKDWVDCLPDIEFAYNTSVHPAIGVTPFELHHSGRKGRIFADLPFPRTADIDAACSPASVRKYRDLMAKARTNMQKAQVRMQQQANRRHVPCPIRAGDLVWVSTEEFALEQDVSRKLLPKWFGPWPVTSAAGDEPDRPSFVIKIPPHLMVHPVFHASKLATYTPVKSDDFPGRRSQDPPSMDGHQEVDRVITHRKHGNKPMQYKVTFKWCDPDDTRWISRAALRASASDIYAHYEKKQLATEAAQPPTRTSVPPSTRQLRPRR